MKRTSEEMNAGNRFKKRLKGTTLGKFFNKAVDGKERVQDVLDDMALVSWLTISIF